MKNLKTFEKFNENYDQLGNNTINQTSDKITKPSEEYLFDSLLVIENLLKYFPRNNNSNVIIDLIRKLVNGFNVYGGDVEKKNEYFELLSLLKDKVYEVLHNNDNISGDVLEYIDKFRNALDNFYSGEIKFKNWDGITKNL